MDIYAAIADERRTLAADLADLNPEQRATPTLCEGWSVHVTLAHLVVPLEVGLPRFALAMLQARGRFDVANDRLARRHARRPFEELRYVLDARADHRFTPPGEGPEAPLTDVLVHGLDIRWPLGLPLALDPDRARTALTALMAAPSAVVRRGSIEGLRFVADDVGWASGSGPDVTGPADALLLAVAGRALALDRLAGDGVAMLRRRLEPGGAP
ncbi:maleylpyruvate isomerase family mycothiol-dependent enzyme [Litorihabitans aurantiacus]|uniref:Mycothiol-dependent maleylpyruvate isomerase metal-binding domain-containing protein n=1 Tax=Litorihabitans aurantiacus TaxID=1930061 RepID=A0AA37UP43_9MICO|nr:maleylpyruvate isomerase family mycothiol-dependent enzyme [Litorihabitans aurantiacus]GMA30563.1 hypothetical protein GCM10025875_05550 [Litorihabitans aurantiacus]